MRLFNSPVRDVVVPLGPDEKAMAELLGSRRFRSSRRAGSPDVHFPHDEASEPQDQDAAGAEIAVAKFVDSWPRAFDGRGAGNSGEDVGGAQVRSTRHEGGRLLVYEHDRDDQVFVLVVGSLAAGYRAVGWLYGGEVKQRPEWWRSDFRYPCAAAPQSALRSFGEAL